MMMTIEQECVDAMREAAARTSENDETVKSWIRALNLRALQSARQIGRTADTNALCALGGQNSICDELLQFLMEACNLRDEKASSERKAQFLGKEVGGAVA